MVNLLGEFARIYSAKLVGFICFLYVGSKIDRVMLMMW